MWPEIYNFFEQYAGVSYNFVEDLQSLSGDAIFIETYDWQAKKDDILENLQEALDCIEEYGQYLGEDMPSKQDLKKIVDNYRTVSDFQLIFTKLDETSTLGSLYNIKCYSNSAIAFITCGQNVPDDIETFNAQRIVKQLLGGE